MKPMELRYPVLAGLVLVLVSLGCSLGGQVGEQEVTPFVTQETSEGLPTTTLPEAPVETPLPASPTLPPAASSTTAPLVTELPTSPPATPSPPAPATCGDEVCNSAGSFLLKRPVAPPGRNTLVVSDRFGEYGRGRRDANHGVSFLNSTGTPVLAAADGEVMVAGNDGEIVYGPRRDYYGNLVILRHTLPGIDQDVFTLYSQLAEISVQDGQAVTAGQEIGRSGSSGAVRGSTLHFEVRLGENNYMAVRNPELWLEPLQDEAGQTMGALAGRILDTAGKPVKVGNILLERLGGEGQPAVEQIYLKTYADHRLAGLNPWGENFAAGDLVPGSYQISFWSRGLHQKVVEILPGQLVFVNFQLQ